MAEKAMDLPEECWELIFSFMEHRHQLSSPSLVCKTFLKIINNLVKTLTVLDPTALVLPDLLRRFTRLRAINLSRFHGDTDDVLSQIANSGLQIESLDVSNRKTLPIHGLGVFASRIKSLRGLNCSKIGIIPSLRDRDLKSIAQAFPCLEELDISYSENYGCSFGTPILTDDGVYLLSKKLKNLRKINLSGNHFITDKSLHFLSMNCSNLSEIVLYYCGFVTLNGVALLLERCANLNSLSAVVMGNSIADSTLANSLLSTKTLSVVDFRDSFVPNNLLSYLAEAYFPLTKLIFANCYGFTSDGISNLLSSHQTVQHLDLQAVSSLCDEDVCKVSKFLPNLTYINLSCCKALTDSTFSGLIRNCPLLSEIKMDCTSLGSQDLELNVTRTRIKHLHLGKNPCLNDECLLRIASICPDLQTLDLSHCSNITERGVLEAIRRFPGIQRLEMNQCSGIKSFVLDFELSKLEALSVSGLAINDYELRVIGIRCPRILQLNLSNCLNITEIGVEQIFRQCKALREINLKRCNNVNINIIWLVSSMPSLKKIVTPCCFVPSESQKNFYLSHGCIVWDEFH